MKTPFFSDKPEEPRPAFSPFGQADPAASAFVHLQPPRLVNNPG
jgi:hypothetical protein